MGYVCLGFLGAYHHPGGASQLARLPSAPRGRMRCEGLLTLLAATGPTWLARPCSRSRPTFLLRRGDEDISPDFAAAAQAQLELLAGALPVGRAVVYSRRENPADGSLEFVPAVVWPAQSTWVVGSGQAASVPVPSLPGGTSAATLLPSYPFTRGDEAVEPEPISGNGLSAPLVYDATVFGVLAVWRPSPAEETQAWSVGERQQLARVARTLAVAAKLDSAVATAGRGPFARRRGRVGRRSGIGSASDSGEAKGAATGGGGGSERTAEAHEAQLELQAQHHEGVLREVQQLLHASVHQLSSPLSAMRTLSKLLLHRLDGSDSLNRELVPAHGRTAARPPHAHARRPRPAAPALAQRDRPAVPPAGA